jgi:hypothetical protein
LQASFALIALHVHIYINFLIRTIPSLHIRDRPLTELPDSNILGHNPR